MGLGRVARAGWPTSREYGVDVVADAFSALTGEDHHVDVGDARRPAAAGAAARPARARARGAATPCGTGCWPSSASRPPSPAFDGTGFLRLSAHAYNTPDDYDDFAAPVRPRAGRVVPRGVACGSVPEPVQLLASAVSRWGEDEWSRGAWSLIGVDGTPADGPPWVPPSGRGCGSRGRGPTRPGRDDARRPRTGRAGGGVGRGARTPAGRRGGRRDRRSRRGAGTPRTRGGGALGGARPRWGPGRGGGGRRVHLRPGGQLVAAVRRERPGAHGRGAGVADRGDRLHRTARPRVTHRAGCPVRRAWRTELRERLATAAPGTSIGQVVEGVVAGPATVGTSGEVVRRFVDVEVVMDTGVPLSSLSARHGLEAGVGEGDRWIVGGSAACSTTSPTGSTSGCGGRCAGWRSRRRGVVAGAGEGVLDGEVHAAAVIVTVPFAVLTADAVEFVPPLPGGHRDTLARLSTGRVEKVVLRLDRRFWPERAAGCYRVHGRGTGPSASGSTTERTAAHPRRVVRGAVGRGAVGGGGRRRRASSPGRGHRSPRPLSRSRECSASSARSLTLCRRWD